MTTSEPCPAGAGERELGGPHARATIQQRVTRGKIEPPAADMLAVPWRLGLEAMARDLRVLDDDDTFGSGGAGRAGRDVCGLAGPDGPVEGRSSTRFTDDPPGGGARDSEAVHRRKICVRLGAAGNNILREPAPGCLVHGHGFAAEGAGKREQPFPRLFERDRRAHSGARQSPDLPPLLAMSRTPSITIALSRALPMS